ncbi:MAG: extracellular solute-binding protein [Blastocatellia bacterium]|nr:extracellular solute-binding protein [Blastocatellia bacterium]
MKHRHTRGFRRFFTFCLLPFAFCLFFVGCGPGKTVLLVYSPHGKELLEEFENRFEATHPTVDVQCLDIASQEILNRLSQERANPQADIWWGASSLTFSVGAEAGLLEPYKPSWAAQVADDAHDGKDRWYATFQTPEVIVYNKELLPEAEVPQDWDELLNERWKGKILIRQPLQSDTMRTIFGAMILREWPTSHSPQKGFEWLKRLDANTKDYVTDGTTLMQKIGRGEGLLSVWNMPDVVLHQRKNLPLGFVFPRSGTPIVTDGIAVVKGSRNQALAREFYEFVTTPESLLHMAKTFDRVPARKDIEKKDLPEWMRVEVKPMVLDSDMLRREVKGWMQFWEGNIRGKR